MQHPTTFRQEIDQAIRSAEQYTKNGQAIRRRMRYVAIACVLAGAAVALLGGCRSITAPATCPASQLHTLADTARTPSGYIVSINDVTACRIVPTVKDSVGQTDE